MSQSLPRDPKRRPAALFRIARQQMRLAREYRRMGLRRSMRAEVFCARENVRLGRKLRNALKTGA